MSFDSRYKKLAVIDLDEYANEFKDMKRCLESPPDETEDKRLSELIGGSVVRQNRPVSRRATAGIRGGRLAVVLGQYLIWDHAELPVPKYIGPDDYPNLPAFSALFALFWTLLQRKLTLDGPTGIDLIRVSMSGRGDTETNHALVKLLEYNFKESVPKTLKKHLIAWGDDFSMLKGNREHKLAKRLYALAAA